MIELELVQIGFISSIISQILALFPFLGKSDLSRAILAIIVTTGVVFVIGSSFTLEAVAGSLVFALTSYKMFVQPLAERLCSK